MHQETDHPPLPTRMQSLVFLLKSKLLQAERALKNLSRPVARHPYGEHLMDASVCAETRTHLWNQPDGAEFSLTAGKVQNLRVACRLLNGTVIPANGIFSFWGQLGRITKRAGYTTGRELRSGCLVPNLGGGLCALSGLLYEAAVLSGCEIIERHGHSRFLPGVTPNPRRDATIFWNYVDLRFKVPAPMRIEAKLDHTHLIIRFLSETPAPLHSVSFPSSTQPATSGDCLSCGETSCFRHPSANAANPHREAHAAYLLDALMPEFNQWCASQSQSGDQWLLPLDPRRWRKANYAWTPPDHARKTFATLPTLLRSWRSRRLPGQGAARQTSLLHSEAKLAEYYHQRVDPCARHLVISQNLLPHLWKLGTLGGRTYEVLLHRLPLTELHEELDRAARAHPSSKTLSDFRADPILVQAESEAIRGASGFVTPHRDLARRLGKPTTLIDWNPPAALTRETNNSSSLQLFLPCSPLGRKGIHELAEAIRGLEVELLILGGATEGNGNDPLAGIPHRRTDVTALRAADALVLPAWVEHQPRLALLALASDIPVIATRACGLPPHPLLREIDMPDSIGIRSHVKSLLSTKHGTIPPLDGGPFLCMNH